MPIMMSRVDERLVHGQVIASWAKQLMIKRIIIVDDLIAKDDFMTQVLTLSSPIGVNIEVTDCSNALKLLSEVDRQNTLVLFKNVASALELLNLGYPLSELNIGNIGAAPGRKQISKNVFISNEDKLIIKSLVSKGVNVYLQMLYAEPKVDVEKYL